VKRTYHFANDGNVGTEKLADAVQVKYVRVEASDGHGVPYVAIVGIPGEPRYNADEEEDYTDHVQHIPHVS
jgi:hypothetical protein